MPKINGLWKWEGNEIFDINTAWKNTGTFHSNLPSYESLTGGPSMPILEDLVGNPAVMVEASWQNTVAMEGRQLLQIGIQQGFDDFRLVSVGTQLPAVASIGVQSVINYAQDVVTDLMLEAFDNLMGAISGIPIYGWIVDITYGVGMSIYNAVTMYEQQKNLKEEIELPAVARYSRDNDETLTTELLKSLGRAMPGAGPNGTPGNVLVSDWTPYFLPRGRSQPEDAREYTNYCGNDMVVLDSLNREKRSYFPGEVGVPKAWGVEWAHGLTAPSYEKGYLSNVPSWGLIPGLPKVQWDWQVAQYDILREDESNRYKWPTGVPKNLGHYPYNDTGDFAPTVKQALFTMWGQVVGNSGISFMVDPERLHTRWMDAYEALRDYITFLSQRDSGSATDRHIAYSLTLMNMCAVHNLMNKPIPGNSEGKWPGPHLDFPGKTDYPKKRYDQVGHYIEGGFVGGAVTQGLHMTLGGDPAQGLLEMHPTLVQEYVMQAFEDGFSVPMPTWYGPSWVRPRDRQKHQGSDAEMIADWRCSHPWNQPTERAVLYWPIVKMMIDNFRDMLHKDFVYKTTVAYVGPQFAALNGSTALKDKWTESRKLLLTHSARHTVDTDLIPDAEYRNLMIQAKMTGAFDIAAAPMPTPPGFGQVDPFFAPAPGGTGGDRDHTGRRFTTGEKLAVAAGLGGAVWWLSRIGGSVK